VRIEETNEFRSLAARYDGMCRAAKDLNREKKLLEIENKRLEADRERQEVIAAKTAAAVEVQINTLNKAAQDLGLEVQRLRALLRNEGVDPDER
jgi:hypothetical protein